MVVASGGVRQVWWKWGGSGDGRGDKGLPVVRSWRLWGLVYISGPFKDVVRPGAVSSLLEPPGNGPVVFEGVVEACPDLCFDQPVVDLLLGVVPLSPVLA